MTEPIDISATSPETSGDSQPQGATRRRVLLGGIGAGLAGLMPFDMANAQIVDKGVLNIAYPVDVPTWDPNALTVPAIQGLYESVFDSPLRFSAKTKLEARQFKEWKWVDTKATRLEVTLRDDVLFHDGTKMTMEDVKYSLMERGRADKKLVVGAFFNLADVEIQSPTKAVLVYTKTSPAAPIYLGFYSGYIVPKAYMTKVGPDGFNAKPIGAGPYKMVEHQRGSRIVLEAFDKYWGGAPAIKQVVVQIVPEPAARVALIESGRVQLATQLPLREVIRLKDKAGLLTNIYPVAEIYMLRIPNYVKPFENDNVRKAMHLAIDSAALSKAFYGGVAKPVSVMINKGASTDVPEFNFPFDKAAAIAELKKAGYGPGNPVKFTLLSTNGSFPSDFDMARAIVQMWKSVGIEATIEETTQPKLLEASHFKKVTGVILYNWANHTGDPENTSGRMLDPRGRFATWNDPALEPRMDALFSEPDEAKRIAGYKALHRETSEKSWAIPILQAVSTMAYAPQLSPVPFESGFILPAEYKYK